MKRYQKMLFNPVNQLLSKCKSTQSTSSAFYYSYYIFCKHLVITYTSKNNLKSIFSNTYHQSTLKSSSNEPNVRASCFETRQLQQVPNIKILWQDRVGNSYANICNNQTSIYMFVSYAKEPSVANVMTFMSSELHQIGYNHINAQIQ